DDGDYVGVVGVTIEATDEESGVPSIEYAIGDGDWTPYEQTLAINDPGDYTLRHRATDNAGNTSEAASVSFTLVEPDQPDETPPEVSASVDGDGTQTVTLTLTATDDDSGVASIEYSTDGGSTWTAYTAPVEFTDEGEVTVQYRATDNAGNTSEPGSVTFTVAGAPDTTAPEVSASLAGEQNDDGDYVESVTVTLSATDDDSGVASIEYALDGGAWTDYDEPVTVTALGDHTLRYRATDNAGNTSAEAAVTFTVVEADAPSPCPEPDDRDTVWIGDIDTGVANRLDDDGCSINDLIDDESSWASTGHFLQHVNDVVRELYAADLIDARERGYITRAAV